LHGVSIALEFTVSLFTVGHFFFKLILFCQGIWSSPSGYVLILCCFKVLPIQMAALSKAWVCGRSLPGIAGSNSTGGINMSFLLVLCVVSGLCVGLITRPEEESCRM